jgi:hypothetical protein
MHGRAVRLRTANPATVVQLHLHALKTGVTTMWYWVCELDFGTTYVVRFPSGYNQVRLDSWRKLYAFLGWPILSEALFFKEKE